MKALGYIFSILMISAIGLSTLADHCFQCTSPCSGFGQTSETQGTQSDLPDNHQDHCSLNCSHFAHLANTELVIQLDLAQRLGYVPYLFSHSPIALDGPFRPPLA